ncbi:unnamed protein product [Hyaloperonospora brassicae]|uniref:EXPERA domain-containing protein n=1 Tax=Hyaloperonospora brassicae TaxID=162125 RepID=A0AAV0UZ94_HYABA|nr:unnamed protein product [Hyaloperonospora brassicae]
MCVEPLESSYSLHSGRPHEPPPPPRKTASPRSRLFLLLAPLSALAVLLATVFYSINVGHSIYSVYLLQVCLAVGMLEISWWHYRIRHRFLASLDASVADIGPGAGDSELSQSDREHYDRELEDVMEPKAFAVARLTDRWLKDVWGAAVVAAVLSASAVAAASVAIAVLTESSVTVCAGVGSFAGVLCACFAPTPGDGFAIFVHVAALTVTAMNTMYVYYTESLTKIAIVDYLFVAQSGWMIIAISRIIASKKLLECFLMVALDTVALLHLTVIMMEMVDFVEHPGANNVPQELDAFFITIVSAEFGHFLFGLAASRLLPRCFWRWRYTSPKVWGSDYVVSVLFGIAGMKVWVQVASLSMSTWNTIALVGALLLSQSGRSFISLTQETAMVPSRTRTTFNVWNNGIVELINPFLVGWIVFHPYAKKILGKEADY